MLQLIWIMKMNEDLLLQMNSKGDKDKQNSIVTIDLDHKGVEKQWFKNLGLKSNQKRYEVGVEPT